MLRPLANRLLRRSSALLAVALLLACGGPAAIPTATPEPTPTSTPVPTPRPTETAPPAPSPTPELTPTPTTEQARPTATPTPTPTAVPAAPLVRIGDATFTVEVAITPEERARGLSGHPPLAPGHGMLFIFEGESRFIFWMKEMLFPLDLVWIDAGCAVADLTLNAPPPAPDQPLADLPRYSPVQPVRYVLEITAGEVERNGLRPGDRVTFSGTLAGQHGC